MLRDGGRSASDRHPCGPTHSRSAHAIPSTERSDVSTTTLPPTAPPEQDVLRPRPRGPLRREIVAVIAPAWSRARPRRATTGVRATRVASSRRPRTGSSASSSPARSSPPPPTAPASCCACGAPTAAPGRSACRRWPTTRSRSSTSSASTRRRLDLGVGWAHGQPQAGPARPARGARAPRPSRSRSATSSRGQRGAHIRERHPSVNRWTAGRQVLAATLGGLVLPFLGARPAVPRRPRHLDVLYWTLVGALAVTAAASGRSAPTPSTRRRSRTHPTARPRGRAP